MTVRKTYLLQYGIVIDVPCEASASIKEELDLRYKIRRAIQEIFRDMPEHVGLQTERILWIYESEEVGRCAVCGIWLTNADPPSVLDGLNLGKHIADKWYCEEHQAAKYRRKRRKPTNGP
jgi:hypothetical protein